VTSKEQLLELIHRNVIGPILQARPIEYSKLDRDKLRKAQVEARRQMERYRGYSNADDLRRHFQNDLSSDAGKAAAQQLRELGLPTLEDIRDQVLTGDAIVG